MAEQISASAPATAATSLPWMTTFKVGAFLLIMMKIGAFAFGSFWDMFSGPMTLRLLATLPPQDIITPARLLGLTILPLILALLTVLGPLTGWWVYSKVEPRYTTFVGWGGVILYLIADTAISFCFAATNRAMGFDTNLVVAIIGDLIVMLYAMFFMGIGFLIAKLFKAKL